jgi:hypothetical protein
VVDEFKDVKVHRTFFQIGVSDPAHDDSWPWYFNKIDGLYLSANFRVCKLGKAIEFETTEAVNVENWTNAHGYKCELIECKKMGDIASWYQRYFRRMPATTSYPKENVCYM